MTNLLEICKENHVSYWLVRKNMKEKGMSIEDAIKNAKPRKRTMYYLNGIPLVHVCREQNVKIETVISRVHRGMTIEEAFNSLVLKKQRIPKKARLFFAVDVLNKILKQDDISEIKKIVEDALFKIGDINDKA